MYFVVVFCCVDEVVYVVGLWVFVEFIVVVGCVWSDY